MAASGLFRSHSAEETTAFRKFIIDRASSEADDVSSDVNVNVFIREIITAFKAEAISPQRFRVKKRTLEHPPGAPNQGRWDSYELYMDAYGVISDLQAYLRTRGRTETLRYKDLRDQLSKNPFFVKADPGKQLNMRFGKKGSLSVELAWGIYADEHPLGLQRVSDDILKNSLSKKQSTLADIGPIFEDADPRKGPLFGIIEAVEKFEDAAGQEEA
jgi:hypothetical protein